MSSMYFRYFVMVSPLENSVVLHLKKNKFPSLKDVIYQRLVKIGSMDLEKMMKMRKVYRQMDDGQQAIRKSHLSFHFRWAKTHLNVLR